MEHASEESVRQSLLDISDTCIQAQRPHRAEKEDARPYRAARRCAFLALSATVACAALRLLTPPGRSGRGHVDPWFYRGASQPALREGSWAALLELKRICDRNRIPFFLTGGTLLGAFRSNDLIPWDVDQDILMLADDVTRLLAFRGRHGSSRRFREGFNLQAMDDLLAARMVDRSTGAYVDIFAFNRSNVDEAGRLSIYSFQPFALALLVPPSNITLRGISFLAPSHVEAFLRTQYRTLKAVPPWLPKWVHTASGVSSSAIRLRANTR